MPSSRFPLPLRSERLRLVGPIAAQTSVVSNLPADRAFAPPQGRRALRHRCPRCQLFVGGVSLVLGEAGVGHDCQSRQKVVQLGLYPPPCRGQAPLLRLQVEPKVLREKSPEISIFICLEGYVDLFFGVTVHVFSPCFGKTLLVLHKKLARWLPPGGRMESGELPEQAAHREVMEELGVEIVPQGRNLPEVAGEVLSPHGLQLNSMPGRSVAHLDFVYHAVVNSQSQAPRVAAPQEISEARWFFLDQVCSGEIDTFPNTRAWTAKIAAGLRK